LLEEPALQDADAGFIPDIRGEIESVFDLDRRFVADCDVITSTSIGAVCPDHDAAQMAISSSSKPHVPWPQKKLRGPGVMRAGAHRNARAVNDDLTFEYMGENGIRFAEKHHDER